MKKIAFTYEETSAHREANFFVDVPRQIYALSRKNIILAYRNRTATFLRIFSPFFFILLIFLVNEALKARFAVDSYFKDFPDPPRKILNGIPTCIPLAGNNDCLSFVYAPAPVLGAQGHHPVNSIVDLKDFLQKFPTCGNENVCEEMFRVHQVVKLIMSSNVVGGESNPILPNQVLGFRNQSVLDRFLFENPNRVQGAYIFASPSDRAMNFVMQINSSSYQVRGGWKRPYLETALPFQSQAYKGISLFFNSSTKIELGTQQFAHPAFDVSTFEGTVAPLCLLACAMFPFVIQMTEVMMERELKLRQALQAMGLFDTAYWLSWHIYQSGMAGLFGFFIWLFGIIFQLRMFHKNDFEIVFLTFWLFGQSMVGLGFLIGAFLSRSAQAVTAGLVVFLVGFVLYFMISLAGQPNGGGTASPFLSVSYTMNITTGNYTKKNNADMVLAPLLAAIPPILLIQCIGDMGKFSAADTAKGLRFSDANSYCVLQDNCDPEYSISKCWRCFIALYFIYSTIGLYIENILPDAMGVRRPLWFFLNPSYWGITHVKIHDKLHVIERSTDEDVIAAEQEAQERTNQGMSQTSAIEIRGLRATFKRGGNYFHAVKCPWFCVGKRQLFALLGPNGAGKTTTINMLTGFLPPTDGNALVLEETVSHSSGMAKIRRFMGFDILWENLSAKEHLVLFGTIKGLKIASIAAEAEKRIEEVRLTESANQRAGALSGGMKRRLSLAVALIGNPEVVYLDEPTTGMDPINRRHVWDVIKAAKQDRSIVLTTHSMEEADILGDFIGVMCKGRLRCIGNSMQLKSRFGDGYKVSVSCGDNMKPKHVKCVAVKDFFKVKLGISVTEETKAYMHFNVPANQDQKMAAFFENLEKEKAQLGIVDVQLSMSTLEDAFLKIVAASELEDSKKSARVIAITLENGEQVGVCMGSEETLTSPNGIAFTVRWSTDGDGNMMPAQILEVEMKEQNVMVTDHFNEGDSVRVMLNDNAHDVPLPMGVEPGQQFLSKFKVPKLIKTMSCEEAAVSQVFFWDDEGQERIQKLRTPFIGQANALFRKNLSLQWKRMVANCCLVTIPLFVLCFVFGIQSLVEVLLLSKPVIRCPYCGPADGYGEWYCNKADSCAQYFFPDSSRQDFINVYGVDVVSTCKAIAGEGPLGKDDPRYCYGNGNLSCYQIQWAGVFQLQFCPFPGSALPTHPVLGYAPVPLSRSDTPILITSEKGSRDFASELGRRAASFVDDIRPKIKGTILETNRMFFLQFVGIPLIGCQNSDISLELQESICRLLSPGPSADDLCCLDLTGNGTSNSSCYMGLGDWDKGAFIGDLAFGVNYWSDMIDVHNDTFYKLFMNHCQGDKGSCNQNIMKQWAQDKAVDKHGIRFGTGRGQYLVSFQIKQALDQQSQLKDLVLKEFEKVLVLNTRKESFRCLAPKLPAQSDYPTRMKGMSCPNLEEAVSVLAQSRSLPINVHPITMLETQEIPRCSELGKCSVLALESAGLYADTPGRWAQVCDFFSYGLQEHVNVIQSECNREAKLSESGGNGCPNSDAALKRYLDSIPCMCRWLYFIRPQASSSYFPAVNGAISNLQLPRMFQCRSLPGGIQDCSPADPKEDSVNRNPSALAPSDCWRKLYHPFSMAELKFVTPIWPSADFFTEPALSRSKDVWWNKQHVLTESEKRDYDKKNGGNTPTSCETDKNCWLRAAQSEGNFSVLAISCEDIFEEACFIQRMGNLSGLSVGCTPAKSRFYDNMGQINAAVYEGQYSKHGSMSFAKEYIGGYDFLNSGPGVLNVSVFFNDSTQVVIENSGSNPIPHLIRISQPLNAVVDAFLNVDTNATTRIYASLMGVRDMPRVANFLTIDFGSSLGPLFFTLSFNILLPTIVESLTYEKEAKLRIMMRMMGLGTSAYWVINYLFWFTIYSIFAIMFILVGSLAHLPSGYTLGLFTRQDHSIHFVFFLFFINHTIAWAMLWSSLIQSSRSACIASTLYIAGMTVIAVTALDGGNFFNTENVSNDLKTFITLWPVWGFYRGWTEYKYYAIEGAHFGTTGIKWSDLVNDPRCGMRAVLAVLGFEWPLFLIFSLYLDQVLYSGHRVPRHPLFFIGFKYKQAACGNCTAAICDEASFEDVRKEEERVNKMFSGRSVQRDAVIINRISKVYPAYTGSPSKIAVRSLTMGVSRGECFGILGPNGAGKTTTINMLVGFTQPTAGTAEIEGFDVCTDMDRIYSLMGVCPQHDILWNTLTARQHLLFYGRLKNLKGVALSDAVVATLKSVDLLHVIDEMAGTYSGGMKRRLSVAIAMIGDPLCCYLDEPSTGLDPVSRRALWACIKEAKRSRAILLTTHSMDEAEKKMPSIDQLDGAEGLCDRLGIIVDGALRCIGNPKELTARFGGFYVLAVTCETGMEKAVSDLVHSLATGINITYSISGTQKFEMPSVEISLARVFKVMTANKAPLGIRDWGIANTTLEEAFIKISRGAVGT